MNNVRRSELQMIIDIINAKKDDLEYCMDEEQYAHDNLPEGLQASEQGEKMENAVSCMDEAISLLEDAILSLQDAIQ